MQKFTIMLIILFLLSIGLYSDLNYRPKTVLAENATATWCGYCPDAYAGLEICHDEYDFSEFVSIRYYATSGGYGTIETDAAIAYYGVTGYPTTIFEGIDKLVGGGEVIATGTPFLNEIEKFYFAPSPISIEITNFNNLTGDISVSIEMFAPDYSIDDAFLRFILLEDDVTAEYTHVTRDIINLNFSLSGQNNTYEETAQFEIIPEVDTDNVYAVVFVQEQDKRVLNATSSYSVPEYQVRAIVPFDFMTFGPSSGTYEEEYFTVLNTGLEDTFNIGIVLDEAPEGTLVTFCNENEECFPSETDITLSNEEYENFHANVMPGGSGMIKYHFEINSDNIEPTIIPFTYITFDTEVLIVDDDGGEPYEDYFSSALSDLGYSYGIWDVSKNKLNDDVMSYMNILVWNVGWSFPSLDAEDREFLVDYIEAGKNVFFSGQDIGWDLNQSSDNTDVEFYHNYLHANYISDDTNNYDLTGLEDDPLWDGVSLHIAGGDGADNQQYPSRISAYDAAATEILFYSNGGAGALQAIHPGSNARIVYFAFGYEAIDNSDDRNLVMNNIVTWFGITSTEDEQILPDEICTLNNYPNPFSSQTTLSYNLPNRKYENAKISIYNIKGQLVKEFKNLKLENGSILWNGRDKNNKPLASGLYFYRLHILHNSLTKKMILTR